MKLNLRLTWRIWLLIFVLVFSVVSVFGIPPGFSEKGVLVKSVDINSEAYEQGLASGQVILAIDDVELESPEEFYKLMQSKFVSNQTVPTTFTLKDSEVILFTNESPEIVVSEIPPTNIKLGLDLVGGSRALVQAENKTLTSEEISDLVDTTQNRLNEFGLTDISVRQVGDLEGNNFMLVEVAGATPSDLEELISQQGKFEAKIGNDTVFVGGERDISSVGRSGNEAYVETPRQLSDGSYTATFRFTIFLSQEAAERHADITRDLEVNITPQGSYLEKRLDFYIDDQFLEDQSLLISEGLKGRVTTQISISGSGQGATSEEAFEDAEAQMKRLQTILITGSLPFKLEIVKLDTISPNLGEEFIRSIILAGLAALLVASLIIFVRYRNFKSSLALLFTSLSEVIIILGIAAFIEWNLDLPSIAGILATIGTGLDDLIVVLDEAKQGTHISMKQRIKRAFAIILGAYFTSLVALFPLLWAGAGLLKGFAFTTIIGITAGVLITRPAFTDIVKKIHKD